MRIRLKEVLGVQTTSDCEIHMQLYILKRLEKMEGVRYEIDNCGNILATKGNTAVYPCVVSHVDTVHDMHNSFVIKENKGILSAWNEKRKVGIGGDDKVGVWACLELIEQKPNIKAVFFTGEEIGCVGSKGINLDFFKDCGYIFGIDRRGKSDFITTYWQSDTVSTTFANVAKPLMKKYRYRNSEGMITDSLELMQRGVGICCVNLSCGYYAPHTDNETVNVKDAMNALAFVSEMIGKLGEKSYPHDYEEHYYRGGYYVDGKSSGTYKYGKKYGKGGAYYNNKYDPYDDWENPDAYDYPYNGYGGKWHDADAPKYSGGKVINIEKKPQTEEQVHAWFSYWGMDSDTSINDTWELLQFYKEDTGDEAILHSEFNAYYSSYILKVREVAENDGNDIEVVSAHKLIESKLTESATKEDKPF